MEKKLTSKDFVSYFINIINIKGSFENKEGEIKTSIVSFYNKETKSNLSFFISNDFIINGGNYFIMKICKK
jgi:hypothetical protein